MKNLIKLLSVLLIFTLMMPSCGNDEPEYSDSGEENTGGSAGNGNNGSGNSSNYTSELIGRWSGSASKSLSYEYVFYENGTGYSDDIQMTGDMGINRMWYKWTAKNGIITLRPDNASNKTLNYQIDGNNMTMTDEKGKSITYRHYNVSTIKPYGEVPYSKGYILNKNTGYYYQISMVKEFCKHATSGENANWKYVQFFGEDGTLQPTGLYCYYTTPYYEGIDGVWSSGTYLMLGNGASGFYKYGAVCYIRGNEPYLSKSDKLVVKKNGNSYVYDYIGDEVNLHLEATK